MFRRIMLSLLLIIPVQVYGQCDKDDPCAPKKEKNSWQKSLATGFNLTQGNSETMLLNIMGTIHRETDQDIIDLGAQYNYGQNEEEGENSEKKTTRNDLRANASYDYLFSERAFGGLGMKYLTDKISDIDYRLNVVPSAGYFLIKDAAISFAMNAGPAYTFEKIAGDENNYFSPMIGDKFTWTISCTSKLYQSADIFFDTSDSDNYMVNAEVGVESALSTMLSLVVALRDTYDHQPAVGKDSNDLALMTALKVLF